MPVSVPAPTVPPYHAFEKLDIALDGAAEQARRGAVIPHLRPYLKQLFGGRDDLAYQLVMTFRDLDAVEAGTDVPNRRFWEFTDPNRRHALLADWMRRRYAEELVIAGRETVSRAELDAAFARHWRVSGTTIKKAAAFFIAACAYMDLPIAPALIRGAEVGRQRRAALSVVSTPSALIGEPTGTQQGNAVQSASHEGENGVSLAAPVVLPRAAPMHEIKARVLYHMNGLADLLPADGKWTRARHDRFVQAFESMLDAYVEIDETEMPSEKQPTGALPGANGFARP